MKAVTHIAAMAPYALADLQVAPGKRLISMAQNESANEPSPEAIEAARTALACGQLYPDPDWTNLRAAISEVHGLDPTSILCGAGSMELIACLARCFAGPEQAVLSTEYAYAFFRSAAASVNAPYHAVAECDRTVDVDALINAADDTTGIVLVANPGNPTGTFIPRDDLVRLRDGLPGHVLLVIDEAYGEYADGQSEPLFDLSHRGDTVILRTFSKAYGLAGARVGWGVFPPQIAVEVRKVLNPNNISLASEAMAAAAMRDQTYMMACRAELVDRRERFVARLRASGLGAASSHTNFVLIDFGTADAAGSADEALRREGVLMRSMAGYGLGNCLRATIASEEDMRLAGDLLEEWIGETGP